jgi:threonine dehydratase
MVGRQGGSLEAADIEEAARLIAPHVRRTPLLTVMGGDLGLASGPLSFKLEMLQHAGSFKTRGAFASLLMHEVPQAGVVAAGGGNHGAAVAYAAGRLLVAVRLFMPKTAAPESIQRLRGYGADVIVGGARHADALAVCQAWVARTGARMLHPFDQRETVLGQGTLACELEQQNHDLDTVLVPVGGGGLIAGIAAWYAGRVKVIAVESETSPALARALEAGQPVEVEGCGLLADSPSPRRVGELVVPIAARHVKRVVSVTQEATREAQQTLWDRLRVVTEPAGAAAFAALLSGRYQPTPDERIGVILSGASAAVVSFGAT